MAGELKIYFEKYSLFIRNIFLALVANTRTRKGALAVLEKQVGDPEISAQNDKVVGRTRAAKRVLPRLEKIQVRVRFPRSPPQEPRVGVLPEAAFF